MQIPNTTLDDISAVIGFSGTLHLSAWFGDRKNLYVPDVINEEHFLARLLGLKNAQRLSNEWGNQCLAIPSLRAYEDLLKRKQIGRMFERGFGSREIAGHFRMTERRVQQICRELEVAGLIAVVGPALQVVKISEIAISPSIIASPIPKRPLRKAAPQKTVTAAGKNAGIEVKARIRT